MQLDDNGYFLGTRLDISVPGVAHDIAQVLVDGAHEICPYSKATRGNIDVVTKLSDKTGLALKLLSNIEDRPKEGCHGIHP